MAANDLQGEVEVTLGKRPYILKFTARGLCQLERAMGRTPIQLLNDVRKDRTALGAAFTMEGLRAALLGHAEDTGDEITDEWLDKRIDPTKILELGASVYTALALAIFGPEKLRAATPASTPEVVQADPSQAASPGASG